MKNKIIIYIMAAFLLLAACNHDISYENEAGENQGTSTYFKITSIEARSVFPDYKYDSFDEYALTGTLNDEDTDFGTFTSYSQLSSHKFDVTEGEWTLNLTAKKGQTIFSSSVTKTIIKGANNVNFELKVKQLDLVNGKGDIIFELTVPSGIAKVTYSLLDFNTFTPVTDFTLIESNVTGQKSTLSLEQVPAGTYYIDAVLLTADDVQVNTYRTVASVCNGITSRGQFTINIINTIYTITYNPGHYSFVDGTIIPASFTMFDTSTITLPDADDISAPFNFLGWYLTNDYSGEALTTLTPTTPGNITLYPRWGNEITCTAEELKEYITDFTNTEIIVHITDLNPDFNDLKDALNMDQTVTVKLDLDACTGLNYFSSTLNECNNLISVSIPENVNEFAYNVFARCFKLQEINYNAKNMTTSYSKEWLSESTGKDAGGVVLNIGAGVESIPDNFLNFKGNTCIKEINFPDNSSLKTIGRSAFSKVTAIQEFIISDNITKIDSYAFEYCENLKTVRISDHEITLGTGPFRSTNIENIYFNGTFAQWCDFCKTNSNKINCNTKNGSNLYLNNVLLTELIYNDKETNISYTPTLNINNITKITIGENVENLSGYFYKIRDLKTIYFNAIDCKNTNWSQSIFGEVIGSSEGITAIIGNKVTKLPDYLFEAYSQDFYLTDVIFEDNSVCSEIGEKAFYNNKNLKTINLPKSITTIKRDAYEFECIENVYYEGKLEEWYSNINFINIWSNPLFESEANLYVNKNELVEILEFSKGTTDASTNDYAFAGCKSLKKVIIPETVTILPHIQYAYYVEELDYNVLETNFKFKDSSDKDYNCFMYMGLKSENGMKVIFGKTVTKIPDYFSMSNKYYTEVAFEEECICSEIGEESFAGLNYLKKVTIPESITSIKRRAFMGSMSNTSILEEINYNAVNVQMNSSWADDFFEYAGKKSPNGIVLTIGADVESIPEGLFYNSNITSVIFEGSKISLIKNNAFYQTSVNTVKYPGTKKQWEQIVFKSDTANPCNHGADLYFNNTLLTEVTFDSDITEVPSATYAGVKSITKITIPEQITKLNSYTFANCTNVTQIDFNAINITIILSSNHPFKYVGYNTEGVTLNIGSNVTQIPKYLFDDCKCKLSTINFPDNGICSKIGFSAFEGISSLQSITLPVYITEFESEAFRNCSGLTEVYYKGTKEQWDSIIFANENSSPCCNGASLYFNGTKVTSVVFSEGTETTPIGSYSGCKDITSITLPSTLKKIESFIFYNCTGLKEITIPEGVEEICNAAFYNCTGLTEINFNAIKLKPYNNFSTVFKNAGKNAEGVIVTFGSEVTEVPEDIFRYNDAKITKVIFAENSKVKVIGDEAFYYISTLEEVNLPESLEIIGYNSFYNTGIKSIVIPDSIKEIQRGAFRYCGNLETAIIGSGLIKMVSDAFQECENLSELTFKDPDNWYEGYSNYTEFNEEDRIDLSDPEENAKNFKVSRTKDFLYKKQ